jgi:uncharacterized circularly permuted ATP-grasp superfamily protein/uncharacterized alpha-E superfamily protein
MPTSAPARTQYRYEPPPDQWDEALLHAGVPRRHWRKLSVALGRMGFERLTRRWQIGQQLIQANGITYNVYGDPQGLERPLVMDPIPLVISDEEWAHLERALVQRATLLNAVLADLYGPQQFIRRRSLPAALLFANPHFLRPCFGITPPQGVYLHSYGADLARSKDGTWWVISDRTQAPSGIGYALENRMVSARTLPAVFNQCRVRPLARFFEVHRDGLTGLAPRPRSNPRVVLLTPGPNNETYFEHSFLARHWGFPLVEGADLTVRDNRVFLKTLAGLEPVDVVVRRLDDDYCDPLELRGDSLLGIPGLTQAVRSGNVAVANALGSGLLESSAHMAFLPGLCRQLFDEDLRMPSVATWWCGEPQAARYVREHFEELVVKPAFPFVAGNPWFPGHMEAAARDELVRALEANPERFVAQEQVSLSTAPVRTDSGFTPRHVVLRVFAAWNGSSYTVMPGGLTRVSTEARSLVVSMQMGGGSKDTWVLEGPGDSLIAQRTVSAPVERRGAGELPSRVADNLFWLGRYTERVEAGVRLVRALLPGLSGEADYGRTTTLETAGRLLAALGYLPAEISSASLSHQLWQVQSLLSGMVYDPAGTSSIGWNLKHVRRVTWQLKERLSLDTWRVLQQLEEEFSVTAPANPETRLVAQMNLLDRVIMTLSAFAGMIAESITRGFGWRFLEIGKRLERALQTAALLRAGLVQAPFEAEPFLETLLHIADSSITYRTRYFTALRTEYVLELLLADEGNPRSLNFQLATLVEHLVQLPRHDKEEGKPLQERIAETMFASVRKASVEDLAARDAQGDLAALEELLRGLLGNLQDLSDAISARHFSHLTTSRLAL